MKRRNGKCILYGLARLEHCQMGYTTKTAVAEWQLIQLSLFKRWKWDWSRCQSRAHCPGLALSKIGSEVSHSAEGGHISVYIYIVCITILLCRIERDRST